MDAKCPAPMSNSLVLQLQAEALDNSTPVTTVLLKAKAVASKLGLAEAAVWIERELRGYAGVALAEMPTYRNLRGNPQALDPHHGWHPIVINSAKWTDLLESVPLSQSMAEVEAILIGGGESVRASYLPAQQAILRKAFDGQHIEYAAIVPKSQVAGVVAAVRNAVLSWSLELEKAGVLGEGMTFSAREQSEAKPVTQVFLGNVGVVGDVSGSASVTNNQAITVEIDRVRDLVSQARGALPQLPSNVGSEMAAKLAEIDGEVAKPTPNQSVLRGLLQSARTIAEGSAGNLAAMGIASLITTLL